MDWTRLAWGVDPSTMMEDCGLPPDPWQRAVLRSRSDRTLLLCCRQAGKSTVTGVLGLAQAVLEPDSLVLILSPSLRQSGELFRKVVGFYNALGCPVPADQVSATTLSLENGSRVVSLPGDHSTIRGFSGPKLVIVDEAALVDDALFVAVNPMLAVSRGRLVLLSTPMGKRGVFYEQWTSEGGPWERTKVTAHDCPRISPEFLAEQRRTLGERWFKQEYLCSFEETIDQVFATDSILAAFDSDEAPLFAGMVA
jgi:Terminase large subunit, T4likevirus-type, N-terminal